MRSRYAATHRHGVRMSDTTMCKSAHMDWRDLEIVLALHRGGSLLQASRRLGVAHTTVGRRLERLEGALGVRLFDRTPSGWVLTAAGDDVLTTARRVEAELHDLSARVRGRDATMSGPLRVSTVDVVVACFGGALRSFVEAYPDVELTLEVGRQPVSLPQREADVVIRMSNDPPENLVGRSVGSLQFGVYASTSLVEQVGGGADLADYPWIVWGGGPNVAWFDGWLDAHAPGARKVLRFDDRGLLMAHAVRAGIGAQLLPCVLADAWPDLVRIAPLDPTFRVGVWVLMLAELRGHARARALVAHMAEALGRERAALEGRTR